MSGAVSAVEFTKRLMDAPDIKSRGESVEEQLQSILQGVQNIGAMLNSLPGPLKIIAVLSALALLLNPIFDLWNKSSLASLTKRLFSRKTNPVAASKIDGGQQSLVLDPQIARIQAIRDGVITPAEAIALAYAEAGERYENAPPPSEELPTGFEPADEFIREFVELATSRNEREREAAALDAEGRTEEALALLETLAQEEAQQAAERWKARGAMAFQDFAAKAIDSYERAVGCSPDDPEAHNQLGHLYHRIGDLERAKAAYEKVLALGNQSADQALIAVANGNLGNIEKTRGNLEAAEGYHKQSLALDEALGHKAGMAAAYSNLGVIEDTRGNLKAAEDYYRQALALNDALGRKAGMATDYGNLGILEQTRGNLDAAEDYHRQALALNDALGCKEGMANQYGNLGILEQTRGNLDAAEAYTGQALVLNEALGRRKGMANQYGNLGTLEKRRGNLDAAEDYYRQALGLNEALGCKEGMANQYGNLGIIERTRGNLDAAEDYTKQALALNDALGRKAGMAIQYGNLGTIEKARGNPEAAIAYWRKSHALFTDIGMRREAEQVASLLREAGAAVEGGAE